MAKISKTKEYAIKYLLNHEKKNPEEIASELKLPLADIMQIVKSVNEKSKNKNKITDAMIRHTSAKKDNNVSIMTEGAAQLSDEFIKNLSTKKQNLDFIHRPKD